MILKSNHYYQAMCLNEKEDFSSDTKHIKVFYKITLILPGTYTPGLSEPESHPRMKDSPEHESNDHWTERLLFQFGSLLYWHLALMLTIWIFELI